MYTLAIQSSPTTANFIVNILPILAIVLIFYFMVIAPASKQRKKTQQMLDALKKGDRVLTTGGIYGTVQGVESDVVHLRIAENVKVRVAKSAIASVVTGDSSAE
jgi:preprotein translocase subunit YajC